MYWIATLSLQMCNYKYFNYMTYNKLTINACKYIHFNHISKTIEQ